jgi:hypothetical protein
MPGRRHLFKGIHDPETVRDAVRWSFDAHATAGGVSARMTLTHSGAGHALPTYVVPQLLMRIELVAGRGSILASSARLIARTVAVAAGRWSQIADTRLRPDETATLTFAGPIPAGARTIVGRVIVWPDAWHVESFQTHLQVSRSERARLLYQTALEETQRSRYPLFQQERALEARPPEFR